MTHHSAISAPELAGLQVDLDNHWGLPVRFYTDPAVHKLDMDAIFHRRWVYLCPAERLTEPGSVVVGHAGEVPVVAVRDDGGTLRAFANICRHRGYQVATQDTQNCKRLVCRYHAWSYWLDGSLANAPGSNMEEDFPKEDLSLRPLAIDTFGPAVFVNVDAAAGSFVDAFPGIVEDVVRMGVIMDPAKYTLVKETEQDVACNWKLWYDNFVECYHCDFIHRGSFAAAYDADIRTADTRFRAQHTASRYEPKPSETSVALRPENYRSIIGFPGFMILQQDGFMILQQDGFMIMSQMRPLGPERARQMVHYFAETGSDKAEIGQWIALWEQTFAEDEEATEVQQAGLRSGAVARNRLLPAREETVLFHNRKVYEAYAQHLTALDLAAE